LGGSPVRVLRFGVLEFCGFGVGVGVGVWGLGLVKGKEVVTLMSNGSDVNVAVVKRTVVVVFEDRGVFFVLEA
jgi:hypothetical protein